MEAVNLCKANRWKKRHNHRFSIFPLSLLSLILTLTLLLLLLSPILFFSYKHFVSNSLQISRISQPLQCSSQLEALGDKFLWYAPHSGFSNQLSEFKNAILVAAILNRTLIIPPVLDHHAVALGSCPKFRVLSPKDLRLSVWNHIIELIRSFRYISMADIVDLSELVSTSAIRVTDFRVFVSMWCGMEKDCAYSEDSEKGLSMFENVRHCGSLLYGNNGNWNKCLYSVDKDCRTTVWTYQKNDNGALDSFQPDEQHMLHI